MAKLIYLDSLDFSDLSATAPSIQNAAALETLALSKKTGTAKFLLSSIHLSEATHSSEKYKDAATRRATLMTTLSKLFDALSLVGDEQAETIAKNFKARLPKHELFRALLESYCVGTIPNIDDDQLLRIVSACPALSAFSNAFLNYAVDLFHANFQKLKMPNRSVSHGKASDFGDLLQASYAPYVDIFRCDGPFGAVLKKDENIRRKIVEKRARLISLLREDLEL